ncbi:ABC transporter ATP-binding protein [Lihuaxuella thermophila]|uniref:Putative ABC transport system ATP-binding protein n=1 Tax=Lihuaxuella thermophila TaxID=1173111 RepID=A0A1H8CC46_9BACL|nr:ABC transporter ATP-binding protein [Lihuaxuella thermophila]SEM92580.1 putative ABC transport system ATP-binding protein [Lihuaxuella thermophila]
MVRLENVTKIHSTGTAPFAALKNISLQVNKGEFVAVMGPSGAGKSTLLQLIGGLDVPTEGSVWVDGMELSQLGETKRTMFRRSKIGVIFQNHQLLPMLTVEENIAFPLYADRTPKATIKKRVARLLDQLGLKDKANSFPSALSGGEQQRVAIARALAIKPALLLADEPTGNLDRSQGAELLKQLSRLHREEELTLIMVTHDPYAAGFAERMLMLRDGRIVDECSAKGGDIRELMENLFSPLDSP